MTFLAQTFTTTRTSSSVNGGVLVIGIILGIGLAFIPAYVASRKGYSFVGFWLFGFLCWIPALIVSLVISDKNPRAFPPSYGYGAPPGGFGAPPPPPPPGGPPPGWYPDPGGSPQQRYWDGVRWTDQLH